MAFHGRRFCRIALVCAVGASAVFLSGGVAQAQAVSSGTFSMQGEQGDYITGGRAYAYSISAGDTMSVSASDGYIGLSLDAKDGAWWSLDLAAPKGKVLAPGTYSGATRYPFNKAADPGLSVAGSGRGCNQSSGSFVIASLVRGPGGYVQKLDATFEQHCENGTAALRGEVHVVNPPPPAQLKLGVHVAVFGTASMLNGKATVSGTVECNVPAKVTTSLAMTQVAWGTLIRGSASVATECKPDASVPWTATIVPSGDTPFQLGAVELETKAYAVDPNYKVDVNASDTSTVFLFVK